MATKKLQLLGDFESSVAGKTYTAGDNISIEADKISVITTDVVEEGNTKPVTASAVAEKLKEISVVETITEEKINNLFLEE